MTIKEGSKAINNFTKKCKKSNDSYLVVHFSKKEDEYAGYENIDNTDALIIIEHLIKSHNLNPKIMAGYVKQL